MAGRDEPSCCGRTPCDGGLAGAAVIPLAHIWQIAAGGIAVAWPACRRRRPGDSFSRLQPGGRGAKRRHTRSPWLPTSYPWRSTSGFTSLIRPS